MFKLFLYPDVHLSTHTDRQLCDKRAKCFVYVSAELQQKNVEIAVLKSLLILLGLTACFFSLPAQQWHCMALYATGLR